MAIVTLILLWTCRKPLTSIQHDHITLNNSAVPFFKNRLALSSSSSLSLTLAGVPLRTGCALPAWGNHQPAQTWWMSAIQLPSLLPRSTRQQQTPISCARKILTTSKKLSSRLPTVFPDLCSLSFTVCDHPQKGGPGEVTLPLINTSHPLATTILIPTVHNYHPVLGWTDEEVSTS